MRNFKKFLALVLAMLMVSACAVSVSAAYADQADIDATGYAEAVSVLSDLGVIKGDGTNFNPNGTLTRAEAAVIAAKLKAGADGQKIEWKSATSSFVDVDPTHWGNAYINYVAQRGIMDGVGGGKFNPDATLTLAEAIVIAVKTAGLQGEVAMLNEYIGVPTYWAANWIAVAGGTRVPTSTNRAYDLTDGVALFDTTVPCSRATFAKIAHNIFKLVPAIGTGFNFVPVTATIEAVTADEVTLKGLDTKIVTSAFNAALAASGIEATAADLKGCEVYLTWNSATKQIISVELNTTVATATYADNAIAYTKDSNGNDVKNTKIVISGVEYIIGETDNAGTIGAIGGTATATKGIALTIDGATIAKGGEYNIPTYYKAFGYDDNNDGDYERVVIDTYVIASVKLEKTTKEGAINIYSINGAVVNAETGTDGKDTTPVIWTGAALVADNETPMLVEKNYAKDDAGKNYIIDVLEVAASVTGKVQGISASGKYLTLTDGSKYYFKNTGADTPANWTLQQTVTFFTIGGEYVKLANASASDVSVIVDNVVVNADNKAVVTGYNASNYAPVELVVDGVLKDGKYVAMNSYEAENKVADKVYAGLVSVGTVKSDNTLDIFETFKEGYVYKFTKTADGTYLAAKNDGTQVTTGLETLVAGDDLKITNGYVYIDDIAKWYTKDVVVFTFKAAKADDYNAYADTWTVTNNLAAMLNVTAYCKTVVDNNVTKVAFVYVDTATEVVPTITMKAVAEGQTIVQVLGNFIEAGYDYFVYEVVDLFAGTKTTVKASGELTKGAYYTAAEGVVVEATGWMMNKQITVTYAGGGLIPTYKAWTTISNKTGDAAAEYVNKEEKEFGLDMMTVYVDADADGIIDIKDGAPVTKAASEVVTETITAKAYVVEGKIILVK